MSHGKLRKENDCLNCGHMVDERYCTHCGQENTEVRQPFHYLFTHFIEDFTHYDGQFWKTIKDILFKPGKLTRFYLDGKRQLYVPPVKLYIFMSFVTFFLSAVLPTKESKDKIQVETKLPTKQKEHTLPSAKEDNKKDTTTITLNSGKIEEQKKADSAKVLSDVSLKEFDENYSGFLATVVRPFLKKYSDLREEGKSSDEIQDKFINTFMHSLPKALFIYLPIFAFILWLFHDKKKWYYFDHGIFTLHYFSFLLASVILIMLLSTLDDYTNSSITFFIHTIFTIGILIYWAVYFLKAHKRIYQQKNSATLFKGITIFFVNSIFLAILIGCLAAISFLMVH